MVEKKYIINIYKVVCRRTGAVYIGSTSLSLKDRLARHRSQCKRYNNNKTQYSTECYNIINDNEHEIQLLEVVQTEIKLDALLREGFHIENHINNGYYVVNKCKSGKFLSLGTSEYYKQYYQEKYKEYHKNYYQQHKDEIKQRYQQKKLLRL